jgi:hypothetical protein
MKLSTAVLFLLAFLFALTALFLTGVTIVCVVGAIQYPGQRFVCVQAGVFMALGAAGTGLLSHFFWSKA